MIKSFQETVKIYQQGKEYYDRLKSVHNLVKDARKVQKSILLIGGDFRHIREQFSEDAWMKTIRRTNFQPSPTATPNCCSESSDVLEEMKAW